MSQHLVTLLLGSNLDLPERNIDIAISKIEDEIGSVVERSEILHTKPVEFVSNNIFCNIAVVIKTQFSPIKLLNSLKNIECKMGRIEDSKVSNQYTDRIIDIDIVEFGALQFECKRLEIPHKKHLFMREFSKNLLLSLKN